MKLRRKQAVIGASASWRVRLWLGLCVGLFLFGMTGCPAQLVLVRPYPVPKTETLLLSIAKQQQAIKSARFRTKADVPDDQGGRVKLDVSFAVKRPMWLRVEAESALAGALLTLTTDGQRYQLFDVRNQRYVDSPMSACSMALFLRVSVPPALLMDALLGSLPVLGGQPVELGWDKEQGGREKLTLRREQGESQVLYFKWDKDSGGFDAVESLLLDANGKPDVRIRHDGFSTTQDETDQHQTVRIPKYTVVENVAQKSEARLRRKESEVNAILSNDVFVLSKPPGTTQEADPCVAP